MDQLAAGDSGVDIPSTDAEDEIGAMARTVIVFRDNAVEREQLAVTQEKSVRERERRAEMIAGTIARFEGAVDVALGKVRGAAQRLETASTALNSAAERRVGGIALGRGARRRGLEQRRRRRPPRPRNSPPRSARSPARPRPPPRSRAAPSPKRNAPCETMSQLATAATRIGEVIGLIQAIAGQTNLLALNATIEAGARGRSRPRLRGRRARRSNRLAGQTAKATEEVATQIGAIQSAAGDATQAIEQRQQHHLGDVRHRGARCGGRRGAERGGRLDCGRRATAPPSEARSGAEAMTRVAERQRRRPQHGRRRQGARGGACERRRAARRRSAQLPERSARGRDALPSPRGGGGPCQDRGNPRIDALAERTGACVPLLRKIAFNIALERLLCVRRG